MLLWLLLTALGSALPMFAATGPWANVLDALDDRRQTAFERGDPGLLRRVYLPHTAVLAADRQTLRAYVRRGLEIDGVSLRLLSVRPVSRGPRRARLRVVDRLGPARVRAPGGQWRALPRDEPTERIIVLAWTPDGWRIASVHRLAG